MVEHTAIVDSVPTVDPYVPHAYHGPLTDCLLHTYFSFIQFSQSLFRRRSIEPYPLVPKGRDWNKKCERLDLTTRTWSLLASMICPRYRTKLVAVGKKLIAASGSCICDGGDRTYVLTLTSVLYINFITFRSVIESYDTSSDDASWVDTGARIPEPREMYYTL